MPNNPAQFAQSLYDSMGRINNSFGLLGQSSTPQDFQQNTASLFAPPPARYNPNLPFGSGQVRNPSSALANVGFNQNRWNPIPQQQSDTYILRQMLNQYTNPQTYGLPANPNLQPFDIKGDYVSYLKGLNPDQTSSFQQFMKDEIERRIKTNAKAQEGSMFGSLLSMVPGMMMGSLAGPGLFSLSSGALSGGRRL